MPPCGAQGWGQLALAARWHPSPPLLTSHPHPASPTWSGAPSSSAGSCPGRRSRSTTRCCSPCAAASSARPRPATWCVACQPALAGGGRRGPVGGVLRSAAAAAGLARAAAMHGQTHIPLPPTPLPMHQTSNRAPGCRTMQPWRCWPWCAACSSAWWARCAAALCLQACPAGAAQWAPSSTAAAACCTSPLHASRPHGLAPTPPPSLHGGMQNSRLHRSHPSTDSYPNS